MKRLVFVGSSSEGFAEANKVADILGRVENVQPVLWTEVFKPGFLTLEALEEQMLNKCCGAVLVATPDDPIRIRGRQAMAPRANVMLEFGLVAGRFGRHAAAVCCYGGAELPSDLKGLTIIQMESETPRGAGAYAFGKQAEDELTQWCSNLLATAEGVPRMEVLHGYSGRWDFALDLNPWRNLPVTSPGYVKVYGHFDLLVDANGGCGRGFIHGLLRFQLPSGNGSSDVFRGEYLTSHEITDAVCRGDGSLQLTTEAFSFQKISSSGSPPNELADIDSPPRRWSACWELRPGSDLSTLGEIRTSGGNGSRGQIQELKRNMIENVRFASA